MFIIFSVFITNVNHFYTFWGLLNATLICYLTISTYKFELIIIVFPFILWNLNFLKTIFLKCLIVFCEVSHYLHCIPNEPLVFILNVVWNYFLWSFTVLRSLVYFKEIYYCIWFLQYLMIIYYPFLTIFRINNYFQNFGTPFTQPSLCMGFYGFFQFAIQFIYEKNFNFCKRTFFSYSIPWNF